MRDIKPLLAPNLLLALALVYTVVLTGVSIIERDNIPLVPIFPMQDKLAHLIAYFLLAICWGSYWLRRRNLGFWRPFVPFMLLGALIYGTIIEVLQGVLTHSRTADIYDILANCLGMFIGSAVIFYLFDKVGLNSKV